MQVHCFTVLLLWIHGLKTYTNHTPFLPPFSRKKIVDVNLQKRNFAGIQFVIWTGGYWIKHNGENFFAELKPINPTEKVIFIFLL